MKYFLILALAGMTLFSSCKKDDGIVCLDKNDPLYQDLDNDGTGDDCDLRDDRNPLDRIDIYLAEKGWTAQTLENGLHYIIDEPGIGTEFPTLNSEVQVHYHGTLENGNVLDSTQGGEAAIFSLNGVIPGWQLGIPLFKKGGKGKLIIPPSLAYGNSGSGGIPSNAVLIFEIELVSFD